MIIFRYLLKEVTKTQLAVFVVLMTIFISQKFVRVLDDASEGGIPGHMVMIFIGLKVPDLAGMMLPLSFFLGILLAYGRIYADSEMTVLHACGVSEWYTVRVMLILGVITAMLTGLFTLYLAPMASEYEYQVKEQIAADSGLSSLIAGRFQQTGNQKAVVFIHEKNRTDNSLEKVFVAQLPDSHNAKSIKENIINSSIVYAQKGQIIEEESGSQRLVLSDGIRYQSDAENNEFRKVAFGKYYIQIQDQKVEQKRRKLSAIPTYQLLNSEKADYQSEIHWRIAFPLACLILAFVAVPLSVVNPRQGKFAKMLPALLLFLSYFLLLTAMRSAIERESIPAALGLWPVHFIALALGVALILQERVSGKQLRAKLPRMRNLRKNTP
ncbi:LPS export ABC transporter permease LptF [Thalassotalea piscium]|uniref:Lipopolysaccharide export system permease protein LptF n=1 Tax=Thalassotalea piscium TaxID=1230533 RepID=A0A7X0NI21_9GAMM|nr:LPS export ABC transporter permease LptF [Thalassotalea piscium]MBB6543843.1 lipopolysaccharide export system permease protein [Thalassotalea piscium]